VLRIAYPAEKAAQAMAFPIAPTALESSALLPGAAALIAALGTRF
jgi:hypothetical protein